MALSAWTGPTPTPVCAQKVRGREPRQSGGAEAGGWGPGKGAWSEAEAGKVTPQCGARGQEQGESRTPGSWVGAAPDIPRLPRREQEDPGSGWWRPGQPGDPGSGPSFLQATRGPTARWTSTSVTPTLATTGPARTAWPPSPACASRATRATTARPTSTSATASPAATAAPARTATTLTSASASRGPQVPGPGPVWGGGGAAGEGAAARERLWAHPQDPTARSTWTTAPATPATPARVWTRLTATSVRVSRATQVSCPGCGDLQGCALLPRQGLDSGVEAALAGQVLGTVRAQLSGQQPWPLAAEALEGLGRGVSG